MDPDTLLAMAVAPRKDSKVWKQKYATWGEILAWMDAPADHKECGNYVLGTLNGSERNKTSIVSRSALTLDADKATAELVFKLSEETFASVAHTTFNSAPDALRLRVVIPTDREMAPDEYHQAATVMMQRLGMEEFDPGSVQPERYMFKPSADRKEWFRWWHVDGDPVSVDELLADWNPDLSALPAPRINASKRNPYEVDGVVGAFNRAYTIEEVIEAYALQYESVSEDRWHLVGARAEAGMSIISDGLVYSHHVTDPAWGKACSAFDLVRLHRFGQLDEDASPQTPVNKLKSHAAMLELASTDAKVTAEIVGKDFAADLDGQEWKLSLRLAARTGRFVDCIENWDLIRDNEPVFTRLLWNELTLSVESDTDLPWRKLDQGGATFGEADRANLCAYIERVYHIRPPRGLVNDMVLMSAWKRFVNPIRDYLETLEWDGTPRLETCLPGVKPTPYTRLVARKCMVAAVARALDPGCKWDHTLILHGDEGLGKSWWVDRVFRGYAATLGAIGDKDTLLVMQRSWLMVADEGHSLKKADTDSMKEFLTRTDDVFRMPYDREAQAHPRHCVIWGTTNDQVFLRRQEGNRRFLIVHVEERVNFDLLTPDYVDQLWAEALALYQAGETLWLDEQESLRAADARERFVEEDAMAGVVQEYLDRLVPSDWDQKSPEARREWMALRSEGLVGKGAERQRRTCSAQVWVEVMGRRFGDHTRVNLLEIANVLKRLPGWHQLPGRHRISGYGPQLVYERDEVVPYSELL